MGKTREIQRKVTPQMKRAKKKSSSLSLEQKARLAAFDAVVKMRDEQSAAMTAKERAEENTAWKEVRKSINTDRVSYREVFVDD